MRSKRRTILWHVATLSVVGGPSALRHIIVAFPEWGECDGTSAVSEWGFGFASVGRMGANSCGEERRSGASRGGGGPGWGGAGRARLGPRHSGGGQGTRGRGGW